MTDDSNDVFVVCSRVIIAMSVMNRHSIKDFKEILDSMLESYVHSENIDEVMKAVMNQQ